MSSKKWFFSFIATVILIAVLIAGLNIWTDPFGVFGDRFYHWYSFNFTNNPKVAKIAYLDRHYAEFDSYVIGSSTTSAYSTQLLNEYTGNRFYNLFMYGCDLYDVAKTVAYVIDNYEVKNIVMPIGLREMVKYNFEDDPCTDNLHAKVENTSLALFYLKYAFVNPEYSWSKIRDLNNDTFLPQKFDVFLEKTGRYDKTVRDIEPIGNIDEYNKNYTDFGECTFPPQDMKYISECLDRIREIKEMCDEKGINFTLILSPEHYLQLPAYKNEELTAFWTGLAKITDFWDFSFSSISTDIRYFYDVTHIRNALGDMILAEIYNDDTIYRPDDLGCFVTSKNINERTAIFDKEVSKLTNNEKDIPVLAFNNSDIDEKSFEKYILAMSTAGYTAVSSEQLIDYVYKGIDLPEKPVLLTFDEANQEIIDLIFPLLKKYKFKATVFNSDKTPVSMSEEMKNFISIEVASNGLFINETPGVDENQYIDDFKFNLNNIFDAAGSNPKAFLYKNGEYSLLNDALLKNDGIFITFSRLGNNKNTLIKGLPQSLVNLSRIPVNILLTKE